MQPSSVQLKSTFARNCIRWRVITTLVRVVLGLMPFSTAVRSFFICHKICRPCILLYWIQHQASHRGDTLHFILNHTVSILSDIKYSLSTTHTSGKLYPPSLSACLQPVNDTLSLFVYEYFAATLLWRNLHSWGSAPWLQIPPANLGWPLVDRTRGLSSSPADSESVK